MTIRRNVVIVAFEVDESDATEAEQIVEDRLVDAKILWQNDSTDVLNNTEDPIVTWTVIPLWRLLEASL